MKQAAAGYIGVLLPRSAKERLEAPSLLVVTL